MLKINLTRFTNAGGCGCKISPESLIEIIETVKIPADRKKLLTGNYYNDDAAVMKLNGDQAMVFTDDFFTPIVDDPFLFGKIAACNALSDIYAMGAKPLIALSILGWPIDKLPAKYARKVLEGAKNVCDSIGVVLAGGHSINNSQPLFGLSVVGQTYRKHIKLNSTAKNNDIIYLTKPLGSGIYSTALKLNKISKSDKREMIRVMGTLNTIGYKIGRLSYVNSMTDVTGFGLLGHLSEMCKAGNLYADVRFDNISLFRNVEKYYNDSIVTSGGRRNWESYKQLVDTADRFKQAVLCDPQTNGGLLISIDHRHKDRFEAFLKKNELEAFSNPIGSVRKKTGNSKQIIRVK